MPRTTNNIFSTGSETSTRAQFRELDIVLFDHVNQSEKNAEEQSICEKLNFPIKLVVSKVIQSKAKQMLWYVDFHRRYSNSIQIIF